MSEHGKNDFWAFVAGAMVGATFALLYAPAKGEETRERIRRTAEDLGHKGEDLVRLGQEEAEKVIGAGKKVVEDIHRTARKAIEDVKKHKGAQAVAEPAEEKE